MTDAQTAADEIRGCLDAHPDAEHFEFPREWLAALLVERDQLKQLRGERAADPAGFGIVALHACELRSTWVQVHHEPCAEIVYGHADDTEDTDAGEILARMAAHRCAAEPKPTDISQVFDVAVDGGTVTAAIHGSRPLDAEEQRHMAEVVRAVARKQRQERAERAEEARQRDEDVRAVDRAVSAEHGTPWDLIVAVRALRERFADRIADVRRRDAGTATRRPAVPDAPQQPATMRERLDPDSMRELPPTEADQDATEGA